MAQILPYRPSHGWYYFRDEGFDAAGFFANKVGSPKLPVNYQILGGSVGGPLVKDRTFFHAHYERFNDDFERVAFLTVPSAGMLAGDFSGAGPTGQIPQLYNPLNVVDGLRQPFANNQIPSSMTNPVYQAVLGEIPPPAPNVSGATSANYSYPNTRNTRVNKYSLRGDHHFANDDTLFSRFSWQNTPEEVYRQFQDRSHGWQTAIGWVNPMGANLVTELNVSLWKFSWLISRPLEDNDWATQLGYDDAARHPVYYEDGSRGPGGLPRISPSGYNGWRGAVESPLADWGMGYKYTASWRRGDHYLKFGIEHTRNLDVHYNYVPPYGNGRDTFDGFATGQITRDAAGNVGADFGEPWADFSLGLSSGVGGNILGNDGQFGHFNQSHYKWFINDDWKVGPNLTLNLGLRWEQPRPPYYEGDPNGQFATDYYYYCGVDYTQANGRLDPVQMMPQGFEIDKFQGPLGVGVQLANLDRRGCYEAKYRYFAPRFGFAWRMFGNNKTVLRFERA